MDIKISKEDYKLLLKHIYIWNWIYWNLSDGVWWKYEDESIKSDKLVHHILKYCDDDKIKTTFEWENIFTDEYGDEIFDDIKQYENYVVEDLTWIDIEEIDREFEKKMNQ